VRNRSVTRNTVIAGNRWGRGGRQVGAPRSWYSEPRNWGRSWWGGRPAWTWGRPWYWQHARWHHGFWNYWVNPPAFWFGTGLAGAWYLSPGDAFAYVNPYYVAPAVGVPFFDYSAPLPAVPAELDAVALPPDPDELADVDTPPPAPEVGLAADADRLLDDARASFRAGDYPKALELVDAAIKVTPSDPTLHEFRALTLFAQGNYQDAAAALYAVLTAGPGWDWATLREQYPDVATYTAQLRTLERFVADNPTLPYGHFVLAYHYLVTQNKDDAVRQLQEVVRLQPDDKLSATLLTSLTNPAAAPDPTSPPAPGR
jgi:tetratricopeptide (TPR) repeat protein